MTAGPARAPAGRRLATADAAPYAAALAALPGAGPAILVQILADWTPAEAWRRVRDGRLSRPRSRRTSGGRQLDVGLSDTDGDTRSAPRPVSGSGPGSQGHDSPTHRGGELARRIDPPGGGPAMPRPGSA